MAPYPLSPRRHPSPLFPYRTLVSLGLLAASAALAQDPSAAAPTEMVAARPAAAAVDAAAAAAAAKKGEQLFRQGEATEKDAEILFGQAAEAYRQALSALSREKQDRAWAKTETRLAAALVSQAERTLGQEAWDQLEEAKKSSRLALEILTREQDGAAWADAQHQLGRALRSQGSFLADADGEKLRAEAIAALRAALTGFDAAKDREQRAQVEADLGLALFTDSQARENEPALVALNEAATAFRQSLTVFTKSSHPREWGDTQNLLGHTLREQFRRGVADPVLVHAAVGAYEAALSVRRKEETPVAWLLIKNNIGTAKQQLASVKEGEERAELLRQSDAALREALAVATPEAYPEFWTPLRTNQLGILLDQGEREKAADAIVEILAVPAEMSAAIRPSLLQILDSLSPEMQDNPAELIVRLRDALNRSLDPTLEDSHGAPAEGAAPPVPPAGSPQPDPGRGGA